MQAALEMRDEGADVRRKPVRSQPASVLSDRTIKEIAAKRRGVLRAEPAL
jgi:hypothetical protein